MRGSGSWKTKWRLERGGGGDVGVVRTVGSQEPRECSTAAAKERPSPAPSSFKLMRVFYLFEPEYDGKRDTQTSARAHCLICMRMENRETFLVLFISPTIRQIAA